MQQFHKYITWRLCVAQHVSGVSTAIIIIWNPQGLSRPVMGLLYLLFVFVASWFRRWRQRSGGNLSEHDAIWQNVLADKRDGQGLTLKSPN